MACHSGQGGSGFALFAFIPSQLTYTLTLTSTSTPTPHLSFLFHLLRRHYDTIHARHDQTVCLHALDNSYNPYTSDQNH